jgi:RNA-directed DNA polymerase
VPVPEYIHGFEKNKSIPKMAAAHVGKKTVISLDIKDFFPSIKQYMVKELFIKIGFDLIPAVVLSEICTYKSYVPQGSLTAPKISNLIAAGTFGPEVKKFCEENDITLTIYADDLTMSFTKDFESNEIRNAFSSRVISTISEIVKKYGFFINRQKTKIMGRNTRQWVCGAVVNDKVNMRKTERQMLRAVVHNVIKNSVEVEAGKAGLTGEAFLRRYAGRINWMCQLNMDAGVQLKAQFRKKAQEYLKKYPDVEIPELAWNSSVEMPLSNEEFEVEMKDSRELNKALNSTSSDVPFN